MIFLVMSYLCYAKEGIITCIPMQNKDRQLLKNWRPISLLNCSCKLASACLANRLKKVLPDLINKDQTGFMAGRCILLHYTEKVNVPCRLLLVDFEIAFDSISWSFINKALDFYNLGSSFKKWINLFDKNINSCVHINGHLSECFFFRDVAADRVSLYHPIYFYCVLRSWPY